MAASLKMGCTSGFKTFTIDVLSSFNTYQCFRQYIRRKNSSQTLHNKLLLFYYGKHLERL